MDIKVKDLKPGMNYVNIKVRVLSTEEPKTIRVRSGIRTISEAIVGDETGRIKLTLWGRAAGKVSEGDAVEISGGWTTSYRGFVQLNVGGTKGLRKISNEEVPKESEIPDETPKAPRAVPARRFRGGFRGRRR